MVPSLPSLPVLLLAVVPDTSAATGTCASACLPVMRMIAGAHEAQRRADAASGLPLDPFRYPPPLSACHALCLRNASASLDVHAAAARLRHSAPAVGQPRPCLFVRIPRTGSAAIRLSLARDSWGFINVMGANVPLAMLSARSGAGHSAPQPAAPGRPAREPPPPSRAPVGEAAIADIGWAARGHRSAAELRSALGLEVWAQLLTFAVVRSPFERAVAHSGARAAGLTEAQRCASVKAFIQKATARSALVVASAERYVRQAAEMAAMQAPAAQRPAAAAAAAAAARVATGCPGGSHAAGSCPQAQYLRDRTTGLLTEPAGAAQAAAAQLGGALAPLEGGGGGGGAAAGASSSEGASAAGGVAGRAAAHGLPVVRRLLRHESLDADYAELCAALGLRGCAPPLRAGQGAALLAQGLGRRLAATARAGRARLPRRALRAAAARADGDAGEPDEAGADEGGDAAGAGASRHYSAYLSNASAAAIGELFSGDVALLGYAFERREPPLPACEGY